MVTARCRVGEAAWTTRRLVVAGEPSCLGAWIFQQRASNHALMDFKGMDKCQVIAGYSVFRTVVILAAGLYMLGTGDGRDAERGRLRIRRDRAAGPAGAPPILPASFVAVSIPKPMAASPGGAVLPKEGAYAGLFLMMAGVSLVGFVINGCSSCRAACGIKAPGLKRWRRRPSSNPDSSRRELPQAALDILDAGTVYWIFRPVAI